MAVGGNELELQEQMRQDGSCSPKKVTFSDGDAMTPPPSPDSAAALRRSRIKTPRDSATSVRLSRLSVITEVISKPFKRSSTSDSNIKVWNAVYDGRALVCARISNVAALTRPASDVRMRLADIQSLEVEDAEGTLQTLPKQLCAELPKLESLSLAWTNVRALPPRLFHLPLSALHLQRNRIRSLDGLEQATNLTVLDVSYNVLERLPDDVDQLTGLEVLNVAGNSIEELPASIGRLSRLRVLNCSHNRLQSLPGSLGSMTQLTILDIGNNQLDSLPKSVGDLANLVDLRAQNNSLRSLPSTFSRLQRLTSLLLCGNNLDRVPPQLSAIASLQSLNVRDNQIARVDKALVPSLKYLVLDQNNLAEIDVGIVNCAGLQLLSLKSNHLRHITEDISRLTNLRSLFLSNNPITHVPVELSQVTHLIHLGLSSTNIQTVPLAVASLPNLHTLALEDCTELHSPLKNAYKSRGRAGVVEYLEKHPNTESQSRPSKKAVTNGAEVRSNSKLQVRSVKTESIMPSDPPAVTNPQN